MRLHIPMRVKQCGECWDVYNGDKRVARVKFVNGRLTNELKYNRLTSELLDDVKRLILRVDRSADMLILNVDFDQEIFDKLSDKDQKEFNMLLTHPDNNVVMRSMLVGRRSYYVGETAKVVWLYNQLMRMRQFMSGALKWQLTF